MNQWKTGISTVYWAKYIESEEPKSEEPKIEEAKFRFGVKEEDDHNPPDTVSWLDELFRGGIKVDDNNPITLLIKGPPGSGKTTFALELCYRLAKSTENSAVSTYMSLESESKQIRDNAAEFGWEKTDMETIKIKTNENDTSGNYKRKKIMNVFGSEEVRKHTPLKDLFVNITSEAAEECLKGTQEGNLEHGLARAAVTLLYGLCSIPFSTTRLSESSTSHIIVIDSLNIFPIGAREKIFQEALSQAKQYQEKRKIKLIIFILDAQSNTDINPFWEYVCDTVIELNHHEDNNYFIRTIEIVKSRFQPQVLGKHQFKIYGKPDDGHLNKDDTSPKNEKGKTEIDTLSRMHPVRKEGGIFIFPSIHFYLSKYGKFTHSGELNCDATYPESFSKFLSIDKPIQGEAHPKEGFPKGRCTALIGCRGGHKSHLAYLHILARLTGHYEGGDDDKNVALIISLRDDEKMITSTLNKILKNEFSSKKKNGKECNADTLVKKGYLEILYYPPGYISPEEFIHRIIVSIHKLKKTKKDVTVIFNSIDQIAARFPLCAKMDIFIPSIIQILTGESITSIFIAVDEKDQPVEQYGLLPMADLILSFHQYQIKEKEGIILTVERFAGGKAAGAKGLLGLDSKINFKELESEEYFKIKNLKK